MNSRAFNYLIGLLVGAGDAAARSYQVGTIGKVPYPQFDSRLEKLASTSWSLKRQLDSATETSHAFLLPAALRSRLGPFDREAIQGRLKELQAEVDEIAFELFRFSDADRRAALDEELGNRDAADESTVQEQEDDDDDLGADATDFDALMSWSVGVAFGRFDWRIATYEREGPPEPDPFEPVPPKSPAMPLDGTQAFFVHSGILVGDSGHSHDLARLVEDVLRRIDHPVPDNVSKWLQTELFPLHLKLYSKSRRKSPIYWPLSTASGGYTLWLYCPDLNRQTLYTAVNEFVEPKLKQTGRELATLRNKGNARSRDEDRAMEALLTLERELVELRDILLQIAPTYCPNHDDGVQITAAPLWLLFRHKPWQKLLKETWGKLEKGDYDWSHLAMAYWPGRVREKCKADKSLAIAHGLEELYEPPTENTTGAGRGGRKRRGAAP